ncbi:MAG TPA: PadR family transcriptional regulator [Nocardioidaceae bacterium]|nr:PadR family transcriptional regulator [Nocardioidaceae bacterium]
MSGNDWGTWGQHLSGGRGGAPWGQGPPPWIAGLLGMAQQTQNRGPKVRRGDVRAAILDVLAVEPMNGYQIIQQIAERSGGAWKPSPGSVYPTLQQLEDEGLVEADEQEGRRTLRLSQAGRDYVAAHPEELADTWRAFDGSEDAPRSHDFKPLIGQVMAAVWQIMMSGNRQQQAEAAEVLAETRRKLYGLLAEGDPE